MLKSDRRLLIIAAFAMGVMTSGAMGEQLTLQEEEADCQADAMQLCGPVIPDHEKIRECLVYYKADLSPACRAIVAPER